MRPALNPARRANAGRWRKLSDDGPDYDETIAGLISWESFGTAAGLGVRLKY